MALQKKKIAYLLGAGATHAEIYNLEDSPSETFLRKNSLLIAEVSKRVMKKAQDVRGFKKDVELVTSPEGSLNIELLISLFASNQIPKSDSKVNKLKKLVRTYPRSLCHYELENASSFSCSSLN